MDDNEQLKVMTLLLDESLLGEFDELNKSLGLRRDGHLRKHLLREIEKLAELQANSPFVAEYLRLQRQASGRVLKKVGIKLPGSLMERINEVCAEKRVPRDLFIETFIKFLVKGRPDIGVDASPMHKALAYINDPYWDAHGDPNIYNNTCQPPEEVIELLSALDRAGASAEK